MNFLVASYHVCDRGCGQAPAPHLVNQWKWVVYVQICWKLPQSKGKVGFFVILMTHVAKEGAKTPSRRVGQTDNNAINSIHHAYNYGMPCGLAMMQSSCCSNLKSQQGLSRLLHRKWIRAWNYQQSRRPETNFILFDNCFKKSHCSKTNAWQCCLLRFHRNWYQDDVPNGCHRRFCCSCHLPYFVLVMYRHPPRIHLSALESKHTRRHCVLTASILYWKILFQRTNF